MGVLPKESVTFNFGQGLETLADPNQLPIGKFTALQNTTFIKSASGEYGALSKRNGFGPIASLPAQSFSALTTFNGALTAIGTGIAILSADENSWIENLSVAAFLSPLQLSTQPVYRSSTNQSMCDSAISSIGTVCTVFGDGALVGSSISSRQIYYYTINDGLSGQNIVARSQLQTATTGTVSYSPKVFALGGNFVIVFAGGSGTANLNYIPISISPAVSQISSVSVIASNYVPIGSQSSFDGVVASNTLYLSWNTASGVQMASIGSGLSLSAAFAISSQSANIMSICADNTTSPPTVWSTFVSGSTSCYSVAAVSSATTFSLVLPQTYISSTSANIVSNLATAAQNNFLFPYFETPNTYGYDNSIQSNFISQRTVTSGGVVAVVLGGPTRGVGLASKAFINPYTNTENVLVSYQSPYQSTYFLLSNIGQQVAAKLAYGNGGGYLLQGLPQVNVIGSAASVAYLVKDLVTSVNKGTAVGSTTQTAAIYTQTGINLAKFQFGTSGLRSTEAEGNLHINGGFLNAYDGYSYAEHNFHLYPDSVEASPNAGAGGILPNTYYYIATYEWTDNTGNVFRSAPSIPVSVVVASGSGSVSVFVPTLKLTAKDIIATGPRIVIYRWSTTQQSYYQVTSQATPMMNIKAIDYVVFNDSLADSQIIGNNLLYTTGGVLEDIGIGACTDLTQFDTRVWAISAEDGNLLYFSKPLVESAPVEMSDLQTLYINPSIGAQGPTGIMKCIFPMDDKLIIFKQNAIYYINGTGPDSTGANSQYSEPIFITSAVGCANKSSIVLTTQGLMFQSSKGIWLLGRNLSTEYIGKDVEAFNSYTVLSAVCDPNTNQARFSLSNGQSIIYDYFVGEWDQANVGGIASTIYNNLHTYIDSSGNAFQETKGVYSDGSTATVMSFTTGWINLVNLQGYQRAYWANILGTFQSGNKYTIGIAYDYNPAIVQTATIIPTNTIGSGSQVEQWQINFQRQQCQSFQLTFNEISSGSAGAGLIISGIDLVYGKKKTYPRNIRPANRTG